jgi:hypothetical protein
MWQALPGNPKQHENSKHPEKADAVTQDQVPQSAPTLPKLRGGGAGCTRVNAQTAAQWRRKQGPMLAEPGPVKFPAHGAASVHVGASLYNARAPHPRTLHIAHIF